MANGIITEFDSKEVMRVRMRFGAEGYLAYVAIQELLYRDKEHAMEREYGSIASEICVDVNVVKGVIEQLDLFVLSDTHFMSNSINAYFESKKKLSESKAKGGYARWRKKQDANAADKKANAEKMETNASSKDTNAVTGSANAQTKGANAPIIDVDAQFDKKKVSPTPPIKKNALTGSSTKNEFSLFIDGGKNSSEPPKRTQQKRISVPTARARDEIFIPKYKSLFGEKPYIAATEMTHLRQILLKLRNQRIEKGMAVDDESLLNAFMVFLDQINKEWVYDNYSPQTINSKFNEIISQIRNRRKNGARINTKGAATVPRRTSDDYDEKDD